MNKIENDRKMPLLHIYPQKYHPNDDVIIVSNKTALLRLKESIQKALEKGEGDCKVHTSDFEAYEIKIILNDEDRQSEFWRRMQLPFFEVNESEEGEVLSVEDIIGFDIKSSEDLKQKQSVMEEYKKHSKEITEKMKQIAKKNKEEDSELNYTKILNYNDLRMLDEYLINHDVNEKVNGESLIYWAVFNNKLPFVKRLLKLGVDPNQRDALGRSLLENSSYFGFYEVCKALLEHGSQITEGSIRRAIHGFDGNRQNEIIELLQEWQKGD